MPYLRNAWYCAGWSSDLGAEPVGRTMLGEFLVFYRDSAGEPVAIGGRCPHRFAPLSKGRVKGDVIECPYHGLQFDRDGRCVKNPHADGVIPGSAKVAAYRIVERGGALWVWMGDADKADTADLPTSDFLIDARYASISGCVKVAANYQLVIDNLLDLTHAPFLHANTVGGAPEDSIGAPMTHEFRIDGQVIHSNYLVRGMPPTPQLQPLWSEPAGDFRAEMRWRPASNLDLDIRMSPLGADKEAGVHVPSVHYVVPESEISTHYFFAVGRNVYIDDPDQTRIMGEFALRAFAEEDEPMIRDCQDLMGTTDLMSLNPVLLKTDIAAVQARRMLDKLIQAQG